MCSCMSASTGNECWNHCLCLHWKTDGAFLETERGKSYKLQQHMPRISKLIWLKHVAFLCLYSYCRIQNTAHFQTETQGLIMQLCWNSKDGSYANKPSKPFWHILLNGAWLSCWLEYPARFCSYKKQANVARICTLWQQYAAFKGLGLFVLLSDSHFQVLADFLVLDIFFLDLLIF
jgi:hypothetical protein